SRGVAHDCLSPTERAAAGRCDAQLMPKRGESKANRFGNQLFDADVATLECSLREPAGLESLLNRKTIIRDVRDELRMSLGLIEAAHDSKANADAVLLHESRNNRVQGTFARSQSVRVIGFHCEKRAAVMQNETCARCYDSRTEVAVITLNQRNDIAVFVDG